MAGRVQTFEGVDYGTRDPTRPGLGVAIWVQYFLDNFATVKECREFLEKTNLQVVPLVFPNGQPSSLHASLEDRAGDSALIEFVKGHAKVDDTREHGVVTNDPGYDKQLENLRLYRGFGGDRPLPGATGPKSRFVRAAYYLGRLPGPKTEREAVALLLGVLRNVSAPFEAADKVGRDYSPTQWRSVMKLTDGVYYLESATRLNLVWVRLDGLALAEGKPELEFDPEGGPDVAGDVTKPLKPAKGFEFRVK